MRKNIISLILGFVFLLAGSYYCNAEENVITVKTEKNNNIVTLNILGNNVFGLVLDFSYDDSVLEFNSCSSDGTYEVSVNQDKVVIDDYKLNNSNSIAMCTFDILDITKDTNIVVSNITYSDSKKLKQNPDITIELEKNNEVIEPNENAIDKDMIAMMIVSSGTLIVICLIILIKKKNNKVIRFTIFIFGLFLLPISCLALNGDFNNNLKIDKAEVDTVRSYLLGTSTLTSKQIKNADADNDNKITIHDLVLMKMEFHKPIIEMKEEVEGKSKYLTKAIKKVSITSEENIIDLRYCITTEKSCKPTTTVTSNKNIVNFDVIYPNNALPQRVCVYAKNKEGFEKNICDTKTYLVDNEIPTIEFNSELIEIDSISYDAKTNIKTEKYGVGGGNKTCDTLNNLKDQEYTVHCKLVGNNGLEKQASFKLNVAVTKNKTAVFYGDSITQGVKNDNKSWANYIGDNYNLSSAVNHGKSGWLISNARNKNWINTVVVGDKDLSFDFVILHGGCNDVAYPAQMGTFTAGDFSGDYDEATFLGGLETYLYTVTTQWPKAKIGYIITYQTPNNTQRKPVYAAPYYEQMRLVLKKWNIPYIDLFNGSTKEGITYSDLLKVNTTEYLPDNLHLNGAGYNVISPYIYEWMRTLPHYSR